MEIIWNGQLTDPGNTGTDISPSKHVHVMLPDLIIAGYTDQEMTDWIIELYAKLHPNPIDRLKPISRPDWVAKEIAQARKKAEAEGDPKTPATDPPTSNIANSTSAPSLPKIEINTKSENLSDVNKKVFMAIERTNTPPELFTMRNKIVRIETFEGEKPKIKNLDKYDIRHEVDKRAFCYKEIKDKKGKNPDDKIKIESFISQDICNNVLATPMPPLPQLDGFAEGPYYSIGATLVSNPGYTKFSKTYYHNSTGVTAPAVLDHPTTADIDKAKDIIFGNLLVDFPFVSQSDRANDTALLLAPFDRKPSSFKHPDIKQWIKTHQLDIWWAVLTMINNWKACNKPKPKNLKSHMGGFENYESVIGGILECNGIHGFLDNRDAFRKVRDEEGLVLEELVKIWHNVYGLKKILISDLLTLIEIQDIPVPLGDGNDRSKSITLGRYLEDRIDRSVSGFFIRKSEKQVKGKKPYYLEPCIQNRSKKKTNVVNLARK